MNNPINYWYQKYLALKAKMDEMMKGEEHLASVRKMSPKDLEEAAWGYASKECEKAAFIAGAEWQKQHDAELIEIAYNDGITIGMTKQKEQMMKEARNHFVLRVLSDNTIKKMIELYNDEVDCKFGDRVRIIIIKEEKNGTE